MLASSSSGNATFVRIGRTRVLIDAGLSRREIFTRLAAIGEDPLEIDAILVTHEHTDHVCGLPATARRLKKPVFLTHVTAPTIDWSGPAPAYETFQAGLQFEFGDMQVASFTIPHDAVDPVGFVLQGEGIRVGIATDLGYVPDSVKWVLKGCHILLLESNHDIDMLKVGPYPWSVKQRVLSRKGHLSNDLACEYIREELTSQVQTLILGHLSENNNHPAIVEMTARQTLEQCGLRPNLVVLEPRRQSGVFQL